MLSETKIRIHNITTKATLKYGSEALVVEKNDTEKLKVSQMRFLRSVMGITRLDHKQDVTVKN
jgi:hypothetical protein